MKIIILGGFLGSGKTSILSAFAKSILDKEGTNEGVDLAIIENEIGEIGIDGEFLNGRGYSVKELYKGCVCCTLSTDLITALEEIKENENPKWVIIEATGLAKPNEIKNMILKYFSKYLKIVNCVIIDSSRWTKLKKIVGELVLEQIKEADILFLNKVDMISNKEKESIMIDMKINNKSERIYFVSAKENINGCVELCKNIVEEMK